MFRTLTRQMRRRIGRVVALAYLVCVVAPPVSLAFTDGAVAAHCLTDDHHAVAAVHDHADTAAHVHATSHDHATHDHATHDHAMAGHAGHDHATLAAERRPAEPQDTGKSSGKIVGGCCGLFCLNAAVEDVSAAIGIAPRASILRPALEAPALGHEPDRIDRPPIVLVSL